MKPSSTLSPDRVPGGARELPSALSPLVDLALDLRWTWSHGADALWEALDRDTWQATRNAWFLLQNASTARLEALASDAGFVAAIHRVDQQRRMSLRGESWCSREVPSLASDRIAYFSMEFGLGEAVPLYAGGLGILAGDFLKASSDLGLSLVGIGILYSEGYFRQTIDADGRQHEWYPYNDPTTLPLVPVRGADGGWTRVRIDVAGRPLWLRAWRATVGRVPLYLLDSNDPLNNPADRGITAKLYGGDAETRLLQELVLGVGGWRLLSALGIEPTIAHLNEGHAAFAVLERARSFMRRERISFREALWATRAGNVFTTHTPVAAAFDRFDPGLVERLALSPGSVFGELGLPGREILGLGRASASDDLEPFNMAYLAMRACAVTNGVSQLHGQVSRGIFADLFPRWPEPEVPIGHVTNGVHVPSWDSRTADELWTRACGKERWRGATDELEAVVAGLSDAELWSMRSRQRADLVDYARARLGSQLLRRGVRDAPALAQRVLHPDVLTLGFARRFAEYKRPNLLLRDPERLVRLLSSRDRPVQLVMAGKAHPADEEGKRFVATWIQFASRPDVRERVLFLEDYDMALAEQLYQGVDVWINNPRRRTEACGTSGMKVLVNGGLNLSERDGWWDEVAASEVGWAWGRDQASDGEDAEQLLSILERDVIPEFHDRDERGLPVKWLARIRASMSRLTPIFSANRMLRDYLERAYRPAASLYRRRTAQGAQIARELARWQESLERAWDRIRFETVEAPPRDGGGWSVRVSLALGEVPVDAVRVELYADNTDAWPSFRQTMRPSGADRAGRQIFELDLTGERPLSDFTARVVAHHPDARLPAELPLIRWQER